MRSPHILLVRLVALSALAGGMVYLTWRAGQLGELNWFAYVFFVAETCGYCGVLVGTLLLWRPFERTRPLTPPRGATLDLVIPVCGEDVDMVEATILAALAIEHPHRTVVLNDGRIAGRDNWREIEVLCGQLGVDCLTRTQGSRNKAGNLNAALPHLDGEFLVALDADHLARPDLAELLLGYFRDSKVGFVSSHQSFKLDSTDLLGHQETLFYRAIQTTKDRDNAAFSCGNGVAYRRAAIDSIGGFVEWNIVEDLTTSYEMHARGWSSAYTPIPVSVGTAPSTAAEMASQRLRWATDSLRLFFWDNPLKKQGLTLRQRLHYLNTSGWYLLQAPQSVYLISPVVSSLLDVRLFAEGTEWTYVGLLAVYLVPAVLLMVVHIGWRATWRTTQLFAFLAPVFLAAIPKALAARPGRERRGPRSVSGVTRKLDQRRISPITVCQQSLLALLVIAIGVQFAERSTFERWPVVLWAAIMAAMLATPICMVGWQRDSLQSLRVALTAPAVAAAVFVALSVYAVSTVDGVGSAAAQGQQAAAQKVSGKLVPPTTGIYLGAYHRSIATHPGERISLKRYPGAKLRLLHRFQAWFGPDRLLDRDWMENVAARGAVPVVTWEPWRVTRNFKSSPAAKGVAARIARGRYDAYIRRWARDAKAYGKPFVLRPMHEMNGNWYPWSTRDNGNTPAQFRKAWRRMHDIFRREGATNVSWMFSIDALAGSRPTTRAKLDTWYPGARYVDWTGISGFNWSLRRYGGTLPFSRVFGPAYTVLKSYGKPIMLSELGTANGERAKAKTWVRDALSSTRTRFPRVKGIIWYDAPHPQRDFRLRGSALQQWRASSRQAGLAPALKISPR